MQSFTYLKEEMKELEVKPAAIKYFENALTFNINPDTIIDAHKGNFIVQSYYNDKIQAHSGKIGVKKIITEIPKIADVLKITEGKVVTVYSSKHHQNVYSNFKFVDNNWEVGQGRGNNNMQHCIH